VSEPKTEKQVEAKSEQAARSLDMLIAANDYLIACSNARRGPRTLSALSLTVLAAEDVTRCFKAWAEALED
jgi:hypothetical protein